MEQAADREEGDTEEKRVGYHDKDNMDREKRRAQDGGQRR